MEKWSEAEIVRFLDFFESKPCLWNPDVPEYRSPDKRSEAIRCIIQQMNLQITEMEIRCKIKNIRSTYLKCLKRELRARQAGLKEQYLPTLLWYNKADSFMREHVMRKRNLKEQRRKEQRSSRNDQDSDDDTEVAPDELEQDDNDGSKTTNSSNTKTSTHLQSQSQRNDAMVASDSEENLVQQRSSHFAQTSGVVHGQPDEEHSRRKRMRPSFIQDSQHEGDEFDTFSRHVGNQLRLLPLERALKCQEAIHSMLMRERIESCQEEKSKASGPTMFRMAKYSAPSMGLTNNNAERPTMVPQASVYDQNHQVYHQYS